MARGKTTATFQDLVIFGMGSVVAESLYFHTAHPYSSPIPKITEIARGIFIR
jgi:hypothetical protein